MKYYLFVDKVTGLLSVKEFDQSNFVFLDKEKESEHLLSDDTDSLTYSILQLFEQEPDWLYEINNKAYHTAQWHHYIKQKVLNENPNYLPIIESRFPSDCFFYHEWDTLWIMHFRIDYNIESQELTLSYGVTSEVYKIITCVSQQLNLGINKFGVKETFPMSLDGWKDILNRVKEISNNFVEMYNNIETTDPIYNVEISWDAAWWRCY